MQKNARNISTAIFLGWFLVLAGAGAGAFYFFGSSPMGLGIVLAAGGLLALGLLFLTCYRLDLGDDAESDKADYEYFMALVPEAAKDPRAFGGKIKRTTNQSTWYASLLAAASLEASAGIVIVALNYSGTVRPALYAVAALVAILAIVGRSLAVKLEEDSFPPEMLGDSASWPALTRLLEEVRASLGARAIHRLAIVPGEGCSVSSSTNRLGFGAKSTMQVGVYLLAFLNEDELRALFAHELTHISNRDTLIGFKSYLNRERWKLMRQQAMEKNFMVRVLFGGFAEYYYRMLTILHSAVGKPHEYQADLRGAELAGPQAFASMLYKVHYLSEFMSRGIDFGTLASAGEIPSDYYSADIRRLKSEIPPSKESFDLDLQQALSGDFDTHPSFLERVNAVGTENFSYVADLDPAGEIRDECLRHLPDYDRLWKDHMLEEWKSYEEEQEEARQLVSSFDGKLEDEQECYQYAMALETLRRYKEALEFYHKMGDHGFDAPVLSFRKGICLLAMDDESGLEMVKNAAEKDPYLVEGAMDLIYGFLASRGKKDELETYRAWFEQKSEALDTLQRETGGMASGDILLPVSLDEETRQLLSEKFMGLKRVTNVYFLCKEVHLADKGPLFVGFETGIYDANKKDTEKVSEIIEELLPRLGFEGYAVYPYEGNVMMFLRTFLEVDGAKVYSRRQAKKES